MNTIHAADPAERVTWLASVPSEPWEANPFRLVSLWDMLRIDAQAFIGLMTAMAYVEADLAHRRERFARIFASSGIDPQALSLLAARGDIPDAAKRLAEQLSWECEELRKAWTGSLKTAEEMCQALQLESALNQLPRIHRALDGIRPNAPQGFPQAIADLHGAVKDFVNRVGDELGGRMFLFVPQERAKYFSQEKPFGEAVHSKFPALAVDVTGASRALGAGLPTAAVFHCMRVVEYFLRRFAKRLEVPLKTVRRKSWEATLNAMDDQITALSKLPNLSARKRVLRDRYAEARGFLDSVRIAWRNPVMHLEGTYSPEEAERIFNAVRVFADNLATKIF